jgi:hypothetical protein
VNFGSPNFSIEFHAPTNSRKLRTPVNSTRTSDLDATDLGSSNFLDKGLHNPTSTSKDVHSQLLQTKAGLETQQTKVKTRYA